MEILFAVVLTLLVLLFLFHLVLGAFTWVQVAWAATVYHTGGREEGEVILIQTSKSAQQENKGTREQHLPIRHAGRPAAFLSILRPNFAET